MCKLSLVVFFVLTLSKIQCQVEFSSTSHDFGQLQSYSAKYVDIAVTNKGAKEAWIFSIRKSSDVTYLISNKIIQKDSTSIVRFQVNPQKKGKFSYEIEVFTSDKDEATVLKLFGELNELDANTAQLNIPCPSFGERPSGVNPNAFNLTVVTVDQETKQELSTSNVTLIQKGEAVWTKGTDESGKIKAPATLGLSYFYATHDGYLPGEIGAYINFKRNLVIIELEKDTLVSEITVQHPNYNTNNELPLIGEESTTLDSKNSDDKNNDDHNNEVIIESTQSARKLFSQLDKNNFDSTYFNAINVVFILDISSSMRQADKIELMKYSLLQLSEMLRPEDQFSIITYASNVQVLLPPTSGASKDMIQNEIKALNANGFTAGGEGIKLGYKTALKAKFSNGNNHVIIITDGAFNRNSGNYKKHIKKYKKKGITMSVVGIKNKERDINEMIKVAELAGGRYVPIMKLSDARTNLKEEVRIQSYKK